KLPDGLGVGPVNVAPIDLVDPFTGGVGIVKTQEQKILSGLVKAVKDVALDPVERKIRALHTPSMVSPCRSGLRFDHLSVTYALHLYAPPEVYQMPSATCGV